MVNVAARDAPSWACLRSLRRERHHPRFNIEEARMRTTRFTGVAVAALLLGSAAAAEGGKAAMAKEHDHDHEHAKAQDPGKAKDKVVLAQDTTWQPMDPKKPDGPQLAVLWGKAEKAPYGFMLKVKAGTMFPRHSHTYSYDAVVLQGEWKHTFADETDTAPQPAGSHWHQTGKQVHGDGCASSQSGECIILVSYPAGKRDFIPAPEGKKPM
jgi:hypothetical protein